MVKTMIYDLEMARVASTVEREYRIILVVKEQEPFKGDRRKKVKKVRYAILENLPQKGSLCNFGKPSSSIRCICSLSVLLWTSNH